MSTIYIVIKHEEEFRQEITTPISAHPTREGAAAEAARLDLDAAWASNQPDYDSGRITHHVYEIPFMSTPLDIAPQVLPSPPAEIYLPLSADEFIALVRDGKVRAETPDGDTSRVQLDRAGDGWATRIGWDYELYDDVAVDYEAFHESMTIDSDTQLKRCDDQVTINGQTFTLTQEP